MNKPDTSIIDQNWPAEELEVVHECPYCKSKERTLAYKDVQDWSFYCAPGKWSYWDCTNCEALYLNPRPKEEFIYKAYASYYTHGSTSNRFSQRLKERIKNECFFHWKNADLQPRLQIPKLLSFVLTPLKKLLHIPYELEQLVDLQRGKLLDVGCGSGYILNIAQQLGWNVTGLEIDPNAVKAAQIRGLNVLQGDYRNLKNMANEFDCVICSHVLEHVHEPLALITLLVQALKPGGSLLLSLPNATSHVRTEFKENWRGLEAPRHVAIPKKTKLIEILSLRNKFSITSVDILNMTIIESNRIKNRNLSTSAIKKLITFIKNRNKVVNLDKESDYIQLICKSNSS